MVSDEASIAGIGFGLAAVSIAGSLYGETWDVEDSLVSFPQERQQQRHATSWLIYRPDNLFGQKQSIIDEL